VVPGAGFAVAGEIGFADLEAARPMSVPGAGFADLEAAGP
jgi:hypothetical protein